MSRIVSRTDTTLEIPPHFKNLTGKEPYIQEFKAGVPTEVPKRIAVYYTTSWPLKFRYDDEPIVEEVEEEETLPSVEFDPVQFLVNNEGNYEQALNDLSRKNLNDVAKQLRLTGFHNQKTEQVIERVLNDIKIQMEKEANMINLTTINISRETIKELRELGVLDENGLLRLKMQKRFQIYKRINPDESDSGLLKKMSEETGIEYWTMRKIVFPQYTKKKPTLKIEEI